MTRSIDAELNKMEDRIKRAKNVIGAHQDGQPDRTIGSELGHKQPAKRSSIHHILGRQGGHPSSPIGNILGHERPKAGNVHRILRKKQNQGTGHIY